MNKKKFKLSSAVNIPCRIEIRNPETESHALLRLSNGDFCDFLVLTLTSDGKDSVKKIEAKTFLQIDLDNYQSLSLDAEFLDETGFVEGELYTGNWEEIILREIELSLSDTPFYYTCDSSHLKFSVGVVGESFLEVELDQENNFSVVCTVKDATGKMETVKRSFPDFSGGAEMIKRLYDRLRSEVAGANFIAKQNTDKEKLVDQFNKTVSESFRFSN